MSGGFYRKRPISGKTDPETARIRVVYDSFRGDNPMETSNGKGRRSVSGSHISNSRSYQPPVL
jgi:hypothetical protein